MFFSQFTFLSVWSFPLFLILAWCPGDAVGATPSGNAAPTGNAAEAGAAAAKTIRAAKNVLVIFSDDQRTDTISAWGNPEIDTPNLDRLSREGISFRQAHCFGSIHGAVCQPSRAMLHSGRSLYRIKMDMSDAPLLGERLGQAGYQTFGTGKWHNGQESFARSFQMGRSIMFGGMSDHTRVPVVDRMPADSRSSQPQPTGSPIDNPAKFSTKRDAAAFSSTEFVNAAIEFLRHDRDASRPFFCYLALTAPHDPRQPPEDLREKYYQRLPSLPPNFLPQHPWDNGDLVLRDEVLAAWPRQPETIRQQLAEYYGLIEHMDQEIGRLLQVLDELQLRDQTLIVFAADHGLAMGSHGLLGKQNLYQHSMGTPVIISGPGLPAGESRTQLIYLFDLMPTICQWCEIPLPQDVEGVSVLPLIHSAEAEGRPYLFTAYRQSIRAIRDQRWKLIVYPEVGQRQLFDLQADPQECVNLLQQPEYQNIPEHQSIVERLEAALIQAQTTYADRAPLQVDALKPAAFDFNAVQRRPDQWQPRWIVDKYFDQE